MCAGAAPQPWPHWHACHLLPAIPAPQVGTEHILLGLIAEDTGKAGFLSSGITVRPLVPPSSAGARAGMAAHGRAAALTVGTAAIRIEKL